MPVEFEESRPIKTTNIFSFRLQAYSSGDCWVER